MEGLFEVYHVTLQRRLKFHGLFSDTTEGCHFVCSRSVMSITCLFGSRRRLSRVDFNRARSALLTNTLREIPQQFSQQLMLPFLGSFTSRSFLQLRNNLPVQYVKDAYQRMTHCFEDFTYLGWCQHTSSIPFFKFLMSVLISA